MTYPFLVMLISLIVWFIMVKTPRISDPWIIRVCEILFAASALVVLFSLSGKSAF
jgi:hypothetical protein